jgi:hypothetical protein
MPISRITILVMFALLVTSAIGDIAIVGEKQYSFRYVINNTGQYPDYYFLTTNVIMPEPVPNLVENGTFGGGYKLNGFILHAVKKADLDPGVVDTLRSQDRKGENLTAYFEKFPLITSNISLPVSTSLDQTIPVDNITVVLSIDDINSTVLNVSKTMTLYGFENGTVSEDLDRHTSSTLPGDTSLSAEMKSLELFS